MSNRITVDVGEFSLTPGGRYRSDGKWSGEEFREDILKPALKANTCVFVNLDRPAGFTTAFLEEVFRGIAEELGEKALYRVIPIAAERPRRARLAHTFMEIACSKMD